MAIRVLWVYDGLTMHQARLAACLARRQDLQLEVICRWHGPAPLDRSLIPLHNLVCRSKLDFSARKAIRERLRRGRFDVVHAYTSRALANVLGACRALPAAPKVVGYRGTVDRLSRLDPAHWLTFYHPQLSQVICVSRATRDALHASGLPDSKLAVVWEGCCLTDEAPMPRAECTGFGIPPDAFVVGVVANMRPVKGVDLLLRAAQELTDIGNLYWLLIGAVRDRRVKRLASDPRIADRVRLVGPRPGGGRYASLFDLYASPSRREGFGIAIMEAMACGVCPIVTNAGGCVELVRHGRDGLVVPPENPAALARAIRHLYQHPEYRRRLAESARHRIASEFAIEAWSERLHELYALLANHSQVRAA